MTLQEKEGQASLLTCRLVEAVAVKDYEAAHIHEDALCRAVLAVIADQETPPDERRELAVELLELLRMERPRWYA